MKMWKQFVLPANRWLANLEDLPAGFVICKTAIKNGKYVLSQDGGRWQLGNENRLLELDEHILSHIVQPRVG